MNNSVNRKLVGYYTKPICAGRFALWFSHTWHLCMETKIGIHCGVNKVQWGVYDSSPIIIHTIWIYHSIKSELKKLCGLLHRRPPHGLHMWGKLEWWTEWMKFHGKFSWLKKLCRFWCGSIDSFLIGTVDGNWTDAWAPHFLFASQCVRFLLRIVGFQFIHPPIHWCVAFKLLNFAWLHTDQCIFSSVCSFLCSSRQLIQFSY